MKEVKPYYQDASVDSVVTDLTSFAAALALGTVYPVTQWEAAIRRVQEEQP